VSCASARPAKVRPKGADSAHAKTIHRQELIATNNRCLAQALVQQNRAAEARPHARQAVEIFTRLGSPSLVKAQAILRECEEAEDAT